MAVFGQAVHDHVLVGRPAHLCTTDDQPLTSRRELVVDLTRAVSILRATALIFFSLWCQKIGGPANLRCTA